ncbi:MAG: IS200/IS605 family transposase [Candidatus Edwardsbacteria bacterium]|nr:IS200/IS605 family transposase [Candidatus Edwardsbacteria bacterium]
MGSTLTHLIYHIVFSTKGRQNIVAPALREILYPYIGGIIRGEKGAMLKIGGAADHVHILASLPPTLSVSEALRRIKGNSSKWVNENGNIKIHFEWQRGYGAFTLGESMIETVSRYIENQEEHHRVKGFKEEYLLFLKERGITYDERYIWD